MKQKFLELNKIEKTEEHIDSTILGSRMTLECVVSMVPRQKLTANGVNKPEQKVWYVRQAILETPRGVVENGVLKF